MGPLRLRYNAKLFARECKALGLKLCDRKTPLALRAEWERSLKRRLRDSEYAMLLGPFGCALHRRYFRSTQRR